MNNQDYVIIKKIDLEQMKEQMEEGEISEAMEAIQFYLDYGKRIAN